MARKDVLIHDLVRNLTGPAVMHQHWRGTGEYIVRVLAVPLYLRIRRSEAVWRSAGVRGCALMSVVVAVATAVSGIDHMGCLAVRPRSAPAPCGLSLSWRHE